MTDYDDDLRAAWDDVYANTPPGWNVGRPGYEERYNQWSLASHGEERLLALRHSTTSDWVGIMSGTRSEVRRVRSW